MKRIIRIKVLILLIVSMTIYSCGQIEKKEYEGKKEYKFNGIYKTSSTGVEFKFNFDTTQSLKIDTTPVINYADFEKIEMYFQTDAEQPFLYLELNETGKKKFAKVTRENIGNPLAIILNDKLLAAPPVICEIPNGQIQVTYIDRKTIEEIVASFKKQ